MAHFTEVFSLDEFSFGSGVTVEVTHFHDLLHARERISVGHSSNLLTGLLAIALTGKARLIIWSSVLLLWAGLESGVYF